MLAGELVESLGGIMRKIRYYEDVEIGEEFVSQTRTITESDVVSFAAPVGRLE